VVVAVETARLIEVEVVVVEVEVEVEVAAVTVKVAVEVVVRDELWPASFPGPTSRLILMLRGTRCR